MQVNKSGCLIFEASKYNGNSMISLNPSSRVGISRSKLGRRVFRRGKPDVPLINYRKAISTTLLYVKILEQISAGVIMTTAQMFRPKLFKFFRKSFLRIFSEKLPSKRYWDVISTYNNIPVLWSGDPFYKIRLGATAILVHKINTLMHTKQ